MKKNTITRIIAGLAFLWIVVSIIWTWLLIIFSNNPEPIELTQEQIEEFIRMQEESQSWTTTLSGSVESPELEIEDIITEVNISE